MTVIRLIMKWILILLALGVISLVSVSPFFAEGMLITDDGNLHLYRSIVLDDALRDGAIYPRYVTGLVYGYGAPLFNYFPPTSYYAIVGFHALGLDWVGAWEATIILYVLLAGWGTYLWARQWMDMFGSFVASAAYVYAPYSLFDTVTRGTSNEFMGMALLPFALWSFTKLARQQTRVSFILATLSYAVFIMAHNVMTLFGSLMLVAYCGFLLFNSQNRLRATILLGGAGLLAVLMTAFFWMPAILETDYIKLNGVLENLSLVDVTTSLRSLLDVFALPQTADPTRLQTPMPITFSWIAIGLAILGFFLPQTTQHTGKILGLQIFAFGIFGIVVYSQLTASATIWQSIDLLRYSFFAWRPMSIGSLVLAVLAGLGGSYLLNLIPNKGIRCGGLVIIISGIVLYSIPWLYSPTTTLDASSLQDAQRYELQTHQATLSSYGEYLPAPTDIDALDTDYFIDDPDASRFVASDVTDVTNVRERATQLTATVNATQSTTMTLNWLYVVGWHATVNGEPVDIVPVEDAGLVGFAVPAGAHEIRVWYGGTSLQQNATVLSVAALGLMFLMVFFIGTPEDIPQQSTSQPWGVISLVVIVTGCVLLGAKSLIIDHIDSPFMRRSYIDGELAGRDAAYTVNFDNQILLLDFERLTSVRAGEPSQWQFWWALANGAIVEDYSIIIELVTSDGLVIAEETIFTPAGLATSNWLPQYYLSDIVSFEIPADAPPIDYDIRLGLYRSATGERLNVLNDVGNPVGVSVTLEALRLLRGDPLTGDDLPAVSNLVGNTSIYDFAGLPQAAQVGDEIVISVLWSNQSNSEPMPEFGLRWISDNGAEAISNLDLSPDYRLPNDTFRDTVRDYVPPTLDAGTYDIYLLVGSTSIDLNHTMTVTLPERNFNLPAMQEATDVAWSNGITLRGYNVSDSQITLYWQTDSIITQNLRVFVQVFNNEEQLLNVSDMFPVNGTRPTTSWVIDEVITTTHQIGEFDADSQILVIGWYDPLTGERTIRADGDADVWRLQIE